MSYFLKFISNLTDASLIEDITQSKDLVSPEELASNPNYQYRANLLYNYLYEKEPLIEELRINQLKKYLSMNFDGVFFRKASNFKTSPTIEKYKVLLRMLSSNNKIHLIEKFSSFYKRSEIVDNFVSIFSLILNQETNDEKCKKELEFLTSHYQIEPNSFFSNLINICKVKNFPITENFINNFMGIKIEDIQTIELYNSYIGGVNKTNEEINTYFQEFKKRIENISIVEWKHMLGRLEVLQVSNGEKQFFNFLKEECALDIIDFKSDSGNYLLSEVYLDWSFLEKLNKQLTPVQVLSYSIQFKKTNEDYKRSSVKKIIKEYCDYFEDDELDVIDVLPKFPILWWGCGQNEKTYTKASFWDGIELIPNAVQILQEGKATVIAQALFGEKGTHFVKIVSDILNNGASLGSIAWEDLSYLIVCNKIINNRDDFQNFYSRLTTTTLSNKTKKAVSYLLHFTDSEFSPLELLVKINKQVKATILLTETEQSSLIDCLNMIHRINNLKLDYRPSLTTTSWKDFHDFLVAENKKIKLKGIKLNQEHLIPFFANKDFIGLKVHVPLFSEDFVWAGNKLGICVGSAGYERIVARNESNIVFLLEGSEVRYVIQFTHKDLIEAKGQGNNPLDPMHQTLLKSFLKENWWNNPKRTHSNDRRNYDYIGEIDDFNDFYEDDNEDDY